eukprot:359936-Chlamydomonas_euryale.AAC.14
MSEVMGRGGEVRRWGQTAFEASGQSHCRSATRLCAYGRGLRGLACRYYTGRLAAYDEDYDKADAHLTYAFENSHRDAMINKRKVLRYLIPVRGSRAAHVGL